LVGPESADDGGVYRIAPDLALVETVDIITPLVDDPFTFGRIAAVNALSDIYAMGGRPVTALNLAFFPACLLPGEILQEILRGGHAALAEAGTCLVGGHTVEDEELKYGLAVTGLIHPERIVRNNTPLPGDQLLLTKPLGSGIIATAVKGGVAGAGELAEAVGWLTLLNRRAAELMLRCGVHAATDVTGFGLIGHAGEMAGRGNVTLRLNLAAIPLMGGVAELAADGLIPAGCYRNRDHYARLLDAPPGVDDRLLPLFDPQTSGGLLIALAPGAAREFRAAAAAEGLLAVPVGEVVPRGRTAVAVC
jgi:selenide,water dikinase